MGMFYRTIRMVDNGIKPVYVFDGKPPTMKSGEVCIVKDLTVYDSFKQIMPSAAGASIRTKKRSSEKYWRSKRSRCVMIAHSIFHSYCCPFLPCVLMAGTSDDVNKFTRRTVRVTSEHNNECKRLLKCMGIPYVEVGYSFGSRMPQMILDNQLVRLE